MIENLLGKRYIEDTLMSKFRKYYFKGSKAYDLILCLLLEEEYYVRNSIDLISPAILIGMN